MRVLPGINKPKMRDTMKEDNSSSETRQEKWEDQEAGGRVE